MNNRSRALITASLLAISAVCAFVIVQPLFVGAVKASTAPPHKPIEPHSAAGFSVSFLGLRLTVSLTSDWGPDDNRQRFTPQLLGTSPLDNAPCATWQNPQDEYPSLSHERNREY